MSKLYEQLVAKHNELRKDRNPLSASIGALIGDITNVVDGKVAAITDDHVISVTKAHAKGCAEMMSVITDDDGLANLTDEMKIFESLLPTMMSDDEMRAIVEANELTTIPVAQKFFAVNHKGQYDGKRLNAIVKGVQIND